jgi:hypothetical protein
MSTRGGVSQKPVIRLQKSGPQFTIGPKRSIVGGTTSGHAPLQRNSSLNPDMFTPPLGNFYWNSPYLYHVISSPIKLNHHNITSQNGIKTPIILQDPLTSI